MIQFFKIENTSSSIFVELDGGGGLHSAATLAWGIGSGPPEKKDWWTQSDHSSEKGLTFLNAAHVGYVSTK